MILITEITTIHMYNLSVCIRQVWLINKTSIRHLSIRRGKIMSSLQTLLLNLQYFYELNIKQTLS